MSSCAVAMRACIQEYWKAMMVENASSQTLAGYGDGSGSGYGDSYGVGVGVGAGAGAGYGDY